MKPAIKHGLIGAGVLAGVIGVLGIAAAVAVEVMYAKSVPQRDER